MKHKKSEEDKGCPVKSFKYPMFPTQKQEKLLNYWIAEGRAESQVESAC